MILKHKRLNNIFIVAMYISSMRNRTMAGSWSAEGKVAPSSLCCYALRLGPGVNIVTSLQKFVETHDLKASFILSCVGSVTKAKLRLAHATAENRNEVESLVTALLVLALILQILEVKEKHEIVSLVGTLSDGGHLHASLSDNEGKVIGGHVLDEMIVFTTAEIVIGDCNEISFIREMDTKTGFKELVIR